MCKSESQFSPFVVKALVDVITGGGGLDSNEPIGIYRSGPKLEQFFLDCNLDLKIGSSSRLPAVTELLQQLRHRSDGNDKLRLVIERVSDPREYLSNPQKGSAVLEHLNGALAADGFEVIVANGKATLVAALGSSIVIDPLLDKAQFISFDTVQTEIARALPSLDADPEDAITAACALVEAVCRSILIELKMDLPAKKNVDSLLRAVQEPLNLSPGRTDLPSEIEDDVRKILSGLTSVVKSIGALRTHAGDAHGREKGFRRVDGRIARMALNAASSISLFLIETWEKKEGRALPSHRIQ